MNYPTILYMDKGPLANWRAKLRWWAATTCLFLLGTVAVQAQADSDLFPPKPEPAVYVHDYAGWLDASQQKALEYKLRRYWDSTSTQIVVMIRRDIGDYDKASYAFELGKRWGIGRKDKDNGIVMLIKSEPPDRGIFIATGYGVEGALPDITAAQIVRNTMSPYFRQQQYYEGIDAGINDIIKALRGEHKRDLSEEGDDTALIVVLLVFLTVLLLFGFLLYRAKKNGTIYTHTGRGYRRSGFPEDGGSRGGSIWWGTGGGWSGGGGSNDSGWGDGGSFGGGDFGGGGAGGDW